MKEDITSFEEATETLYHVFARYPYGAGGMEACPCCTTDEDKRLLTSKPLRLLTEKELIRFAHSALYTWGGEEDFKHYLPRIFELTAKGELMVDTFVIIGKLEYAKWHTWKDDEQQAVREFIIQWWARIANERSYYDKSDFVELYNVIGDIDLMLSKWNIDAKSKSVLVFIDFVYYGFNDLYNYKGDLFKLLGREGVDKMVAWACSKRKHSKKRFSTLKRKTPLWQSGHRMPCTY